MSCYEYSKWHSLRHHVHSQVDFVYCCKYFMGRSFQIVILDYKRLPEMDHSSFALVYYYVLVLFDNWKVGLGMVVQWEGFE